MLRENFVSVLAVKIVGVDGGERFFNRAFGHEDGVGRAPRLGAAGGQFVGRGQLVEFLKNVFHGDALLKTRADDFAELRLDVLADDEHELAEARAHRVVNRVVNDGLAVGPTGSICFSPP